MTNFQQISKLGIFLIEIFTDFDQLADELLGMSARARNVSVDAAELAELCSAHSTRSFSPKLRLFDFNDRASVVQGRRLSLKKRCRRELRIQEAVKRKLWRPRSHCRRGDVVFAVEGAQIRKRPERDAKPGQRRKTSRAGLDLDTPDRTAYETEGTNDRPPSFRISVVFLDPFAASWRIYGILRAENSISNYIGAPHTIMARGSKTEFNAAGSRMLCRDSRASRLNSPHGIAVCGKTISARLRSSQMSRTKPNDWLAAKISHSPSKEFVAPITCFKSRDVFLPIQYIPFDTTAKLSAGDLLGMSVVCLGRKFAENSFVLRLPEMNRLRGTMLLITAAQAGGNRFQLETLRCLENGLEFFFVLPRQRKIQSLDSKSNGILAFFPDSALLEEVRMMLSRSTWYEVEEYLEQFRGIIIPAGSTEQHGPIGLIGTDAICAETISERAGERAHAMVAPSLAYSPAPFNALFPGTISVTESLFARLAREIVSALKVQGFRKFYFLNGHGANVPPLMSLSAEFADASSIRVRSWWDFPRVAELRTRHFGEWEGMHATPSEISITQYAARVVESPLARKPPEKLSPEYLREHAGDRHGPAMEHKRRFPDGRVGSHSALASWKRGRELLDAAVAAVADDYSAFVSSGR